MFYISESVRIQELVFAPSYVYAKGTYFVSILTPVYGEFRLNPYVEPQSDLS
jgi:hypothetical protein